MLLSPKRAYKASLSRRGMIARRYNPSLSSLL